MFFAAQHIEVDIDIFLHFNAEMRLHLYHSKARYPFLFSMFS